MTDTINSAWTRVFYHDSSTNEWFNDSESLFANTDHKFNILGSITNRHRIGHYFIFMLEYGESGQRIIWKQKKNIKDTTKDDTSDSIGYVSNGLTYFGGMTRSDSHKTIYDGVPPNIESFYSFSIGAKSNFGNANTFAGPTYSGQASERVTKVSLWLKTRMKTCILTKKHKADIMFITISLNR